MSSFADESISFEHYADRWAAFGWNAVEINGHDMNQLVDALDNLPPVTGDKPTVLICNTIKGKGVSFMEGVLGWHAGALSEEDMNKAMADVEAAYEKERSAV